MKQLAPLSIENGKAKIQLNATGVRTVARFRELLKDIRAASNCGRQDIAPIISELDGKILQLIAITEGENGEASAGGPNPQ